MRLPCLSPCSFLPSDVSCIPTLETEPVSFPESSILFRCLKYMLLIGQDPVFASLLKDLKSLFRSDQCRSVGNRTHSPMLGHALLPELSMRFPDRCANTDTALVPKACHTGECEDSNSMNPSKAPHPHPQLGAHHRANVRREDFG